MPFVKCARRLRGRERKVQKIIICVDVCVCERECVFFQELMNEGVEESWNQKDCQFNWESGTKNIVRSFSRKERIKSFKL